MNINPLPYFVILMLASIFSCADTNGNDMPNAISKTTSPEAEKQAILARLNNETKDAFRRDYQAWTNNWVHDPSISKVYMDYPDSSFSESIGWEEISRFVKTFIEEHPEPEPIPELLEEINVRWYGDGAWVTYEQLDSLRGRKRETRLMEKVDGEWKIAGMQTTIYGFVWGRYERVLEKP